MTMAKGENAHQVTMDLLYVRDNGASVSCRVQFAPTEHLRPRDKAALLEVRESYLTRYLGCIDWGFAYHGAPTIQHPGAMAAAAGRPGWDDFPCNADHDLLHVEDWGIYCSCEDAGPEADVPCDLYCAVSDTFQTFVEEYRRHRDRGLRHQDCLCLRRVRYGDFPAPMVRPVAPHGGHAPTARAFTGNPVSCPYCRYVIKVGVPAIVCPACALPHHEECWRENGGCTTYGCAVSARNRPTGT